MNGRVGKDGCGGATIGSATPLVETMPLVALLDRCRFPDPDEGPFTLAVSGGPDSVALMVLARWAGVDATVVHVDHGLRPGSPGEAAVVREMAGSLGFSFESKTVSIHDGPDLEARARRERYRVLPDGVLTGHTMDDQAETVLLNVLRGAALDGLAGMGGGPRRAGGAADSTAARLVRRPLLGLRRVETVEVCRRAGLEPISDPTNLDRRFRRNRVRSEVLPLLCEVSGRDLVPVLARQAEFLREDVDLLDGLAAGIDPTVVEELLAAPPALARRALRSWLRTARSGDPGDGHELHPPSAGELARVWSVVHGRHKACQIEGGWRVARTAGRLRIERLEPDRAGGRS